MSTESQFDELGRLVREARTWFNVHRANDGMALGKAIVLAQKMLTTWAERYVADRLDQNECDAEDLLDQAGIQMVVRFPAADCITGKEFYRLLKKIVSDLVHDLERRRYARRRHGPGQVLSLERDAEAARQAALLIDDQPTGEDLAVLRENKGGLRRVLKRLTREERQAVRMIMQGMALAQIIELYGVRMRAAWRRARARLREGLAA